MKEDRIGNGPGVIFYFKLMNIVVNLVYIHIGVFTEAKFKLLTKRLASFPLRFQSSNVPFTILCYR